MRPRIVLFSLAAIIIRILIVVGHLPQGVLRSAFWPQRSGLWQKSRILCLHVAAARGLARPVHADPVSDRRGDGHGLLGARRAGFPRLAPTYLTRCRRAFLRAARFFLRAARDELLALAPRAAAA